MFKHLKRIKKINKSVAVREANEIDYDEEGRAQINVGLKTAEDFFSPFSYKTYCTDEESESTLSNLSKLFCIFIPLCST